MKRILVGIVASVLIAGCGKDSGESVVHSAVESGPAPVYVPVVPGAPAAPAAPAEAAPAAEAAVPEAAEAPSAEAQPAAPAPAAEGGDALAVAQKAGCLGCHDINNKKVGPAWKAVSAHYKGKADAKATLAASIKNGSKGKWAEAGGVPMPPQAGVSEADRNKLVDFILAL